MCVGVCVCGVCVCVCVVLGLKHTTGTLVETRECTITV